MRDGDFELVTLRNGSRAVRSLSLGEVMHPSVGPWKEANLLYIDQMGVGEALRTPGECPLCIYDVGLGAATNAAAALEATKDQRRDLLLISFEQDLAPLRLALADPEGFPFLIPWADAAHTLMRDGRFRAPGITWLLLHGDVMKQLDEAPAVADIVFFDPFSPASSPGLWTAETFRRVHRRCSSDALLATYSAATPTRVSMLLGGFFVGAGAGVGTKQETTMASTSLSRLNRPLESRWLERWQRSSARAPHGEALTPRIEEAVRGHAQFATLRP
ncbi:MAG: MnmC family methyltransferase [Myxococcaceae bacterium]